MKSLTIFHVLGKITEINKLVFKIQLRSKPVPLVIYKSSQIENFVNFQQISQAIQFVLLELPETPLIDRFMTPDVLPYTFEFPLLKHPLIEIPALISELSESVFTSLQVLSPITQTILPLLHTLSVWLIILK